jgi:general stress protein 26
MNEEQKSKLATVLEMEHLAVLITHGTRWPTGTLQAFAQTEDFEIIFIMGMSSERFENLSRRPHATVLIDTRDKAEAGSFAIARVAIQGIAHEVARASAEWDRYKAVFLEKNSFEEPFFANDNLRMIRIEPRRVSYAHGLADTFWVEL